MVVAQFAREDLRLMAQTAISRRVDHPIPVPLKRPPIRMLGLGIPPAPRSGAEDRIRRQQQPLTVGNRLQVVRVVARMVHVNSIRVGSFPGRKVCQLALPVSSYTRPRVEENHGGHADFAAAPAGQKRDARPPGPPKSRRARPNGPQATPPLAKPAGKG